MRATIAIVTIAWTTCFVEGRRLRAASGAVTAPGVPPAGVSLLGVS
jgi:hypothetical protein